MQTRQSSSTAPTDRPGRAPGAPPPVGAGRRALAVVAAAAAVPYLALKLTWLAGSPVGLRDPDLATSSAMLWLNALTMLLDVVALTLAVVLMTRRGLRAPAWLVLPPMWIGAGLLGQILVALPVSFVARAVAPSQPPTTAAPPPIAGWVFGMVYTGFAVLGIGLLGAFALYARQRWGGRPLPSPTPGSRTALLSTAGLLAAAAVAHLVLSDVPLDSRVLDLVVGAVGVVALVALARAEVRGRAAVVAVVLAFVATGASAGWGTYLGVITAVPNALVGQTAIDWVTVGTSALRTLAGLAGASALLVRLR